MSDFDDFEEEVVMIELRQRTPRAGYQRLSTEDEIDNVPILNAARAPKEVPTTRSAFCEENQYSFLRLFTGVVSGAKICFLFSFSGIIFLSIIAYLLWTNSLYLKVNKENTHNKPKLVEGCVGAILMYVGCLGLSGYFWYKAATDRERDPRFVD